MTYVKNVAYLNYIKVRSDILEMRDDSEELSQADASLCKSFTVLPHEYTYITR